MNNLKRLRKESGLYQKQVAEKLNIERSSVARWETGKSMPRADKLPLLAALYKCNIEELYDKKEA